jgi:hypothetical protein
MEGSLLRAFKHVEIVAVERYQEWGIMATYSCGHTALYGPYESKNRGYHLQKFQERIAQHEWYRCYACADEKKEG